MISINNSSMIETTTYSEVSSELMFERLSLIIFHFLVCLGTGPSVQTRTKIFLSF